MPEQGEKVRTASVETDSAVINYRAIDMKGLFLGVSIALCAHFAYSQSEPIVAVDNITVIHEHKGWRVIDASTTPIHFNLIKGDLIVRIDGKNAADTGPMLMASLFNEGHRQGINLFIERGGLRMAILLREIRPQDYEPVGANPFRRVASGFSAPDAEFNDLDGQPLTLEQFKGKWLLIDFMGTWCEPCMEALPEVMSSADRDQVSLLLVTLNDRAEAVRRMRQNYKVRSPIAMMGPMSQLPIDFGISTNLWTGQIPAYVLIRPDGEVALIAIGALDADHIEKIIDSLMSSKEIKELK
jgi:thiol-disulfide isomerase/thioredoxin